MKVLVVITLAVFSCSVCWAEPDDNVLDRNNDSLVMLSPYSMESIFKSFRGLRLEEINSYLTNTCSQQLKPKIQETISEFNNKSWTMFDNTKTFCSRVRNDLTNVSQPLIDLVEECVPKKSKGLPTFLFESALQGFQYVCKSTGESILELVNSCILEISPKNDKCLKETISKFESLGSPSKNDICSLASSAKICFYDHVQTACKDPMTQKSFTGLFEAFYYGCNIGEEINNL